MAKKKAGEEFDKKNLVKFQEEPDYQNRIDNAKLEFRKLSKAEMAIKFRELSQEEDKLDEQLSDVKVRQEAITQLIVEILDDEGITKFTLADGHTFYQEQKIFAAIQDREKFYTWMRANGLGDLFTVNYQTAASLVKERLEAGHEVPPGTAAFLKTALRMRRPSVKN